MNNDIVLQCDNLWKSYQDASGMLDILKGLNFTVKSGETIGILGRSGSGKSTLLHLLGGLDKPTQGEIFWQGESIWQLNEKKRCIFRNQHLGFIYQFHHLMPEFNALENIAMPLLIRGMSVRCAKKQASTLLAQTGLAERWHHRPSELSGGERQRIAIARALIVQPKCLLADEPTGNLDQKTAQETFSFLLAMQKQLGISFVIVTHNIQLAQTLQKCYQLERGVLSC
jgi:lipoprotein-releasing system ATP-binding protein